MRTSIINSAGAEYTLVKQVQWIFSFNSRSYCSFNAAASFLIVSLSYAAALVLTINPYPSPTYGLTNSFNRILSASSVIFPDTPTFSLPLTKTRSLPVSVSSTVARGALFPFVSLAICTNSSSPTLTACSFPSQKTGLVFSFKGRKHIFLFPVSTKAPLIFLTIFCTFPIKISPTLSSFPRLSNPIVTSSLSLNRAVMILSSFFTTTIELPISISLYFFLPESSRYVL